MHKKLTITLDDAVYDGLHAIIGRGKISRFLNDLARPHVVVEEMDDASGRKRPTKCRGRSLGVEQRIDRRCSG